MRQTFWRKKLWTQPSGPPIFCSWYSLQRVPVLVFEESQFFFDVRSIQRNSTRMLAVFMLKYAKGWMLRIRTQQTIRICWCSAPITSRALCGNLFLSEAFGEFFLSSKIACSSRSLFSSVIRQSFSGPLLHFQHVPNYWVVVTIFHSGLLFSVHLSLLWAKLPRINHAWGQKGLTQ